MHYSSWNDDQTEREVQQTMGKIWLEYTEGKFQERNGGEQEKVKKEMEIFDNIDICI